MKRDWVEAQVTWNIYSTGNSWQTAGATGANDYDSSAVGSGSFANTDSAYAEKTITFIPTNKPDLDLGYGWLLMSNESALQTMPQQVTDLN